MKRISLNGMNDLQIKTFTEELQESSGCARIFVHPCASTLPSRNEETIEPADFLRKIITTAPQKQTPIIVFEDHGNSWSFERLLKDAELSRNIYMIETKDDDPEPKEGWPLYVELFQKLGIKKMIIGGIYLYEYGGQIIHGKDPKKTVRGCVHGAAVELSRCFEIKISHFVNPGPSSVYAQYCGKFSPQDHLNEN